jgi:hypothetical protein
MTPPDHDPARVAEVACDSADYRHAFYGILNAQGQFWTPLPFHDEDAARAHLRKWAVGDYKSMLETHKVVPVRVQLTKIEESGQ